MKIRIQINDVKTGAVLVERFVEIAREGDLERDVAVVINDARKKGLESFGWHSQVDKG